MSLPGQTETKDNLGGKLEKYRILLEKEYELRTRLSRSQSVDQQQQCFSCCDCGKKISSPQLTYPNMARSKSDSMRNQPSPIMENDKKKTELQRQLSVDNVQTPNAVTMRKIAAKEKAEKRRASLRSLEEDFVKATSIIRRQRTLSLEEENINRVDLKESLNLGTVKECEKVESSEVSNDCTQAVSFYV